MKNNMQFSLLAMAVTFAAGAGADPGVCDDAVEAGATRAELLETVGVAILMGGGPGSIHAAHALDAIEQFLPESDMVPEPV